MKRILVAAVFGIAMSGFTSCQDAGKSESNAVVVPADTVKEAFVQSILTAEEQASMTPQEIIGRLKKGNENFVNNNLTQRDHSAQRRKAMIGQYPKAIVLSCVDSRVPVEDVFDLGIGSVSSRFSRPPASLSSVRSSASNQRQLPTYLQRAKTV